MRLGAKEPIPLTVALVGSPTRFGLGWRADDAESEAVIVNRLTPGAPAALAGLRFGDRIYRVNGQTIAGSDQCSRLLNEATGPVELELESQGRIRVVRLTPLAAVGHPAD